jgi:RNA polymerase primary sigma factor
MPTTLAKDTDETLQLLEKAQGGCRRSENTLVKIYVPYVNYMVRKYSKKTEIKCDEDLRSYVNMGLLDGIRKFDPTKNTKFIYFAHIWMKKAIFLGEMSYRFIKIPINQKIFYDSFIKKIKKAESLGELLDISDNDIDRFAVITDTKTSLFTNFIKKSRDADQYSDVIEFPESLIQDRTRELSRKKEEEETQSILKLNIIKVLKNFTEKEVYIINNVFGLNGSRAISIEQIASNLGVTKVNITFTKTRVIRMLRHRSLSNQLLEGV